MDLQTLQRFCSVDETRISITTTFTQRGYTWATDGRIIVRVPIIEGVREAAIPDTELLGRLIAENIGCTVTPPAIRYADAMPPCEKCSGTGKMQRCHECDGEGDVHFKNDYNEYECECRTCNGRGVVKSGGNPIPCESCAGTGEERSRARITVGANNFGAWYVWLVGQLPGARIATAVAYEPHGVVRFDFDGGRGLLCALRN